MKKIKLILLIITLTNSVSAQSPSWQWAKSVGGTDYEEGNSVVIDAFGNVLTTGYFNGTVDFDPGPGTSYLTAGSSGGYADIFISKFDASGNFVWVKALSGVDDEYARAIALDASGNIFTTGYFGGTVDFDPGSGAFNLTSISFEDFFISKLDSSGNFIWAKQIGASNIFYTDASIAIDMAGSGTIYSAGRFSGTADFDPGAGVFNLTSAGSYGLFILKLDSSGNFIWAKAMNVSGINNEIQSIAIDPSGSGNVYSTGLYDLTVDFDPGPGVFNLSTATGSNYDIFISKLDSSGNFIWAKSMGGTSNGGGESIAIDPTGNGAVYTTGFFWSTADFDPGPGVFNLSPAGLDDIFISKLDSAGNFIWAKSMGGTDFDAASSLAFDQDGEGDIYITGFFSGTADLNPNSGIFNLTAAGETDIFVSRYDSSGNFIWASAAGGLDYDEGYAIATDAVGHAYITGYYDSPSISFSSSALTNSGYSDIYLAKLDTAIATGIHPFSVSAGMLSIFPNPFSPSTTISFSLPFPENISLNVIDVNGRLIKTLAKGEFMNGNHRIMWNATDIDAGIYFLRIEYRHYSQTKKIFIIK